MGRIFFVRKIIHKWFGLPRKALALILTVVLTLSVLGGILAQIKPTQTEPSPAPADDPPPGPYDAPDFGVLSEVRFLDVGMNYIGGIALDAAHKVWSWGWNQHGQLGINKGFQMGPTSPPNRMGYAGGMIRLPYFVDNDIDIVDIAAGYHFNLALDDEGNVYSWGHNGQQQTGFTTNTTTSGVGRIEPAVVQGLPKIVKIKTNNAEITNGISMALDENGGLWVWGANLAGTHGQGNTTTTAAYQATPHKVIFPENVQVVDFTGGGWGGANANVQVIDSNGDRWGWGINDGAYRMLGLGVATATIIQPTKAARQPGMGDLVQIDSSFRATVALDENHNVWQWGRLFLGPGVGSETTIPIPTVLEIDPAEITRLGYTPIPQRVTAGESVCYFIDQYGRPWAWGSGRYFGFGREGGYEDANSQVAAKAQQWPREIGDGDTQTYDDSPKIRPPTAMGNRGIHLHPTIYDEKYADNPMEDIWKDLAFRPIPKLKYIYAQRSAYTLMDENGNIYKWTNDGSGAIAWGWDYTNPQYDPPDSGNIKEGLYNVYSYEVMFMRGSPRMAPLELTIDKPVKKIYKGVSSLDTDTLAFKLKIPPSFTSAAMNINIDRKIRVMKYVIIPYDPSDPNFQITDKPTKDQFNDAYDAAAAGMKGDFLNGEIIESSNVEQIINENIVIDDNCKVWVMVSDEGYVQGELRDNILVHTADNFYTPVNLYERGVERNDNDVELYPSTQEQVAKVYPTAYDSAKFGSDTAKYSDQEPDVYGVPLDVNGAVITAPIFGHDQVEITALDVPRYAVSGTKPDSTPQINPVTYTLNQDYIDDRPHYNDRNLDGTMTAQAITENTHTFYYSFALPYKGAYINGAARPSNGLQTAPREVDLGTSIVYRITAENKGTA
ncbi:MAG TPA: hypothetical protein DEQ02_04640, partial [Ruminococcaceae bacterium]|nr:hypothetical protein [Oscillospiraceae bacterium]